MFLGQANFQKVWENPFDIKVAQSIINGLYSKTHKLTLITFPGASLVLIVFLGFEYDINTYFSLILGVFHASQ